MNRPDAPSISLARHKFSPWGIVAELTRPVAFRDSGTTVDVWCVALHQPLSGCRLLQKILPEAEFEQGMRLRSVAERRRFLVRRAARRLVLSRYLGRAAETLVFTEGEMGKPALVHGRGQQFSCSASGGLALIGVTMGRRVGVDVEQLRIIPDPLDVVSQFFARGEFEALRKTPPTERSAAFLRLWTCKEAWVKAIGAGLSVSFDSFEIECDPLPRLKKIEGDPHELRRWSIQTFVPAPGFIGAVAVERFGLNDIAFGSSDPLQQSEDSTPCGKEESIVNKHRP